MDLQNLKTIAESDSSGAGKDVALGRMPVVYETAAALLIGWTLAKIEETCKRYDSRPTVERLNKNLTAGFEQVFSQTPF